MSEVEKNAQLVETLEDTDTELPIPPVTDPEEPTEPESPEEPEQPVEPEVIGYVTVEEATEFVTNFYTETDPAYQRWMELSEKGKEIYLRKGFYQIERLPFIGCKKDPTQLTQFPRCFQEEVPMEVKYAQISQAVGDSDESAAGDAAYRLNLQRQGVSSFTIGKLSESYGGDRQTSVSAGGASAGLAGSFINAEALVWLQHFIEGSFPIV